MSPTASPSTVAASEARLVTATIHPAPRRRSLPLRYAVGGSVRRVLWFLIKGAFALVVCVALAPVVLVALGYQPAIFSSDSMKPAIAAGDIVVNEIVSPSAVRVGDVVTFSDSAQGGRFLTERVLDVGESRDGYSFTTRGDAAPNPRQWSIPVEEPVTRVAFQAPGVGRTVTPATVMVMVAGLVVGSVTISRFLAARRRS